MLDLSILFYGVRAVETKIAYSALNLLIGCGEARNILNTRSSFFSTISILDYTKST